MENKCNPAGFVESVIQRIKTDTAFRAAMSRADKPAQESCAWEYLVPFCNIECERERMAFALVGAAIARNRPDADCNTGFGNSMRAICSDPDDIEREGRRFRRVIACGSVQELVPVLRPLLTYLSSKGGKISYRRLLNDLLYWNKEKSLRWAAQFFQNIREESEPDAAEKTGEAE